MRVNKIKNEEGAQNKMKKYDLNIMSRNQLRSLHRAVWFWLAAHPDMEKWEWPYWDRFVPPDCPGLKHRCFACIANRDDEDSSYNVSCKNCPIEWTGNDKELLEEGRDTMCSMDNDKYTSPVILCGRTENKQVRQGLRKLIATSWKKNA